VTIDLHGQLNGPQKGFFAGHGKAKFVGATFHAFVIAIYAKDNSVAIGRAIAFETFPNGGAVVE
jgi:hypothetical protein